MVKLNFKDNSIDITNIINDNNHYYYINNYILFYKNFINWICMSYLKINPTNVSIIFLDSTANQVGLKENQYIHINSYGYTIESYK